MAARLTPSPPREWPTSRTRERSALGASRTAAGAVDGRAVQSAQRARCCLTSEERACAPASSAPASWPLTPFAEIDTVTYPWEASSFWSRRYPLWLGISFMPTGQGQSMVTSSSAPGL